MSRFTEVADRVWVARYEWWDANVTLVAGSAGVVVVDTHASTAAGRVVLDDVRRVGVGPVTAVVNTHWHFDHTFGNAAFVEAHPGLPIHATEEARRSFLDWAEGVRALGAGEEDERRREEIRATELVAPDTTFSSAAVVDLGDRLLELAFLGRGHTAGDLVARVPEVDVVLAGDLVEQSGPPYFNADAWPLEWPHTVETLSGMLTSDTVVVPGHGTPVDRGFVQAQGLELGQVSRTIQELAAQGVPIDEALETGEWPWPREHLAEAVTVGYAQLPPAPRQLPLV